MNIYDAILEEANGSSLQGGHLHEELWNRLLRLEDARHHNVRVTNMPRATFRVAAIRLLAPPPA
jgi:hypothetical protein